VLICVKPFCFIFETYWSSVPSSGTPLKLRCFEVSEFVCAIKKLEVKISENARRIFFMSEMLSQLIPFWCRSLLTHNVEALAMWRYSVLRLPGAAAD
jgi:hypothetical protein